MVGDGSSPVPDLRSKIVDVLPRSNFLNFHTVLRNVWRDDRLSSSFWSLRPPLANTGSATVLGFLY